MHEFFYRGESKRQSSFQDFEKDPGLVLDFNRSLRSSLVARMKMIFFSWSKVEVPKMKLKMSKYTCRMWSQIKCTN